LSEHRLNKNDTKLSNSAGKSLYIMFLHTHQDRSVTSLSNAVGVIKRFSFIFYLYNEVHTILEQYYQPSELSLLLESNCRKSLETSHIGRKSLRNNYHRLRVSFFSYTLLSFMILN